MRRIEAQRRNARALRFQTFPVLGQLRPSQGLDSGSIFHLSCRLESEAGLRLFRFLIVHIVAPSELDQRQGITTYFKAFNMFSTDTYM